MRLEQIITDIKESNKTVYDKARERTANLIMPPRAMGRLNDISEKALRNIRNIKTCYR
ncbi:MAG: hypothetical protein LRY51_13435 [Geovibrio sp.]|nr:hypothetical protein [Geovibrio sp.]